MLSCISYFVFLPWECLGSFLHLYGFLLCFSTIGGLVLLQYRQADTTWEWLLLTCTTHTTRSRNNGVRVVQVVDQYYGDLHIISKTAVLLNSMTHMSCMGHAGCEQWFMSPTVGELHNYIIVVTLMIYSLPNAWLVNHYFTTCMSHARCTDHGLVYIHVYPKSLWWYTVHQPYNSNHRSKTRSSHTSHSKMKMPLYRSYQFVYIGQPSWLVHSYPERVVWVQALAGVTVLCSWARHLTLTVPLSTQEYKWVPVNC